MTIHELPDEILEYLISFLNTKDLALLCMGNKKLRGYYEHEFLKKIPFLIGINKELKALGYDYPNALSAYKGLDTISPKTLLIDYLQVQATIRRDVRVLEVEQEKIDANFKEKLLNYENQLEILLGITPILSKGQKKTEEEKIKYLEEYLNGKCSSPPKLLQNPILMRMYVEVIRIRSLKNSDEASSLMYKKLILVSLILLRNGDRTALFCLTDIAKQYKEQKKTEMLRYIKTFLLHDTNDLLADEFLKRLMAITFQANNIHIQKNNFAEKKQSFMSKFDYSRAFFYPQQTIYFFNKLSALYGEKALIYFSHISNSFFDCLLSPHAEAIFQKFLVKNVGLLNDIESFFEHKKGAAKKVLNLARHPALLNKLSVEEIIGMPVVLATLIGSLTHVYEPEQWDKEYIDFFNKKLNIHDAIPYVNKLNLIKEIIQYWPKEDVLILLEQEQKLISTVTACNHRHFIFSHLSCNDLMTLHQTIFEKKSLLQIICANNNLLFAQLLLKRQNTFEIENILRFLTSNKVFKALLLTPNSHALLSKFPKYFQALRKESADVDPTLTFLLQILEKGEQFFLFIMDLCDAQFHKIEKNKDLILLLMNPLIYQYAKKWALSLNSMRSNSVLLSMLTNVANENSHIYMLDVDFKTLNDLYLSGCLKVLLTIKSETLFAWVLFDILVRPKCYTQGDTNRSLRSMQVIAVLTGSLFLPRLDNFGYKSNLQGSFNHCDELILKNFDLNTILKLNAQKVKNSGKNLLEHICSLNPCIFVLAKQYAKSDNKIDNGNFIDFYSQSFWNTLDKSTFGWMLAMYFDSDILSEWDTTKIGDATILEILSCEKNKILLNSLIQVCQSSEPLPYKDFIIKSNEPPSFFMPLRDKFNTLTQVLCKTGFIFMEEACVRLLSNFDVEQIIEFSNYYSGPVSILQVLALAEKANQFTIAISLFKNKNDYDTDVQKIIALLPEKVIAQTLTEDDSNMIGVRSSKHSPSFFEQQPRVKRQKISSPYLESPLPSLNQF